MNPNRKVPSFGFGVAAFAVAALAAALASAQPRPAGGSAGAVDDTPGKVPFTISLWPETGRPGAGDRTRAGELEAFLGNQLGSFLAETEYSSIRVEVLADWDTAAERLRQGGSHVVECEPVLYFLTVATRERLESRYRVILQSVTDPMPRGLILAPRSLDITRPEDLQGRSVAFLHRIAGGAAQIQRALNDLGIAANRDYSFQDAGYLDNAFRNLEMGLVDAVAVPSDTVESQKRPDQLEGLATVFLTHEILPPLFAARRQDLERFPAFGKELAEALRSFLGPERLVQAGDDLYERAKQEGLPWE
jgi:hypothetical protein